MTAPGPRHDVINDALDRLAGLGFETGPGFSAHGPMAAEALLTLGYPGAVPGWIDRYTRSTHHQDVPGPHSGIDPLDETSWQGALGHMTGLADWRQMFRRELASRPWPDVLARWWPRLLPGMAAALTHGLIRTAHAARALAGDPGATESQTGELADGLAYWAARYLELPHAAALSGDATVPQALARLPRTTRRSLPLQMARLTAVSRSPAFARAVDSLAAPADVPAALGELTAHFAGNLLASAPGNPVPLVHTVTAPAAVRMLLPCLPAATHLPSYTEAWHVAALPAAAFGPPGGKGAPGGEGAAGEGDAPGEGGAAGQGSEAGLPGAGAAELAARAAEHGDAHVIKLTGACLREYRAAPGPAVPGRRGMAAPEADPAAHRPRRAHGVPGQPGQPAAHAATVTVRASGGGQRPARAARRPGPGTPARR
jgi:hypothetical protein